MKINWGTGILIAFGLFISFILCFVFTVQRNPEYDNELVIEEYYKHDAYFGNEMQKVQAAADLVQKPSIAYTVGGIKIDFPKEYIAQKVTGKVSLYRPSAKKMDFEIPLRLSGSSLLIPKSEMAGGNWDIILSWSYGGKDFILQKPLYIK